LLLSSASIQLEAQPSISLGEVAAQPLREAPLKLRLSGLEGNQFVRLRLRIQFPARQLDFDRVKIEESDTNLSVTTHMETEVRDSEDVSTLSLEVNAPESIPSGELLELVLRTTDEIYEAESLAIKIIEASLTGTSGEQVTDLTLNDGKVMISIPIFSCFFYMH
jgi:hypothetical protein